MKVQTMEVTPALAKQWLKSNKLNRPVRQQYVNSLAESMQRGEWAITHQPIAINGSQLIDGQHRLMALIQSELPKLEMTVAHGVDPAVFDVIDIGRTRSHADIFREDKHVMNPISYIGRLLYGHYTPRELRPIWEKLQRPMREVVDACHRFTRGFSSSPVRVAALAAILDGTDKKYVLNLYGCMSRFELDGLPRVAQIFTKQLTLDDASKGKIVDATQREQLLVRAFTTFQKESADLQRLKVKDPANKVDAIRKIYRKALHIQA